MIIIHKRSITSSKLLSILFSQRHHVDDVHVIALPSLIQHIPATFNIARVDNAIVRVYNMRRYTITRKTNAVQREIDRDDNPLDTL